MNIEYKQRPMRAPQFRDIEYGDCFIYNRTLYMRVHGFAVNAVSLKDGATKFIDMVDTEVEPVKAKVEVIR